MRPIRLCGLLLWKDVLFNIEFIDAPVSMLKHESSSPFSPSLREKNCFVIFVKQFVSKISTGTV
jgi:hypothetical protein